MLVHDKVIQVRNFHDNGWLVELMDVGGGVQHPFQRVDNLRHHHIT